jgi:caffeoyl-CoA O-methyltransferase
MRNVRNVIFLVSCAACLIAADAPPGGPEGRRDRGPGRPPREGGGESTMVAEPAGKNDEEKKILAILDDMDKNQRRGNMNVPREDGRLLRLLAEASNAKHVVEIGTSTGYSGIWFCLALRTTGGKLTTFEIDHNRAEIARENFKRAGVEKLVALIEGNAHEEITKLKDPVDVVFIDADKEGYNDYLTKLLPLVRPGGLVCAHNMRGPTPDPKFIEAITKNPELETLFLNMQGTGVAVTMKKR